MVHLLPLERAMHVALIVEQIGREDVVGNLGFLKTQDVRLLLAQQELLDDAEPRSDRVHVPGCDLDALAHGTRLATSVCDAKERPPLRGHGARADQAFVTQGDQTGRG